MRDRLRSIPVSPSRRQFIAGAMAASLLAACSDSGGDEAAGTPEESEFSVVRFYGPYFVAGAANRVPFGLADIDGLLPTDLSPEEVMVTVADPDGVAVADGLVSAIHDDGLPRPYYTFEFTPEAAGFYDFQVEFGDEAIVSQVQIVESDDPFVQGLIGPGDPMPAMATPTVSDPMGVTPLCTREPPCDLHDVTVADVVGTGPMVLLVATPAFCQTVVCGPVLDVMIDQMPEFAEVTFIHAEVYVDPANNSTPVVPEDFAPVIETLGLPFEPVLYTVDADGTIRERLDYIFDGEDIRAAVRRLVG